jgi:N-acetylglucosaminyl-diphospho-decaprenol L-rhamnosyltransferase
MATLDIVIVNWNTQDQLRTCLQSIPPAVLEGIELLSVVVVDNASTDGSLRGTKDIGLPLRLLINESNTGFAAACNQGARQSNAEYLLFLNPDTRLVATSLLGPIKFLKHDSHRGFGICGVSLFDDYGLTTTSARPFPTPATMWLHGLGLHRVGPSRLRQLALTKPVGGVNCVDQVIGAYFLIRRDLFEQLGGFDEAFFVYYEEVDLSLRAREAGYASCVLTDVSAFHSGCGSSDQVKDRRLFYSWRSRLQYAGKHFSWPGRWGISLLTFVAEPTVRIFQAVLCGSTDRLGATVRAYIYLTKDLWTSRL